MKAYSYIRFSTPDQIKGDSLRRQTEASEQYCKAHGLTLDTSLTLRDLGLSAYHGKHKSKGALGVFLRAVEEGKIEPGSVLIVENLDRLSREEVLDALNQFTGIIQAGIRLVTLQDGMSYDKQSIKDNWTQLIISITYMARAWEESETKSKRLKATWEQKRNNVNTAEKKMTSRIPAWLTINKEKTEFILKPEVCKAIDLIYRKKLAGAGSEKIAREMNQMPDIWIPPIKEKTKDGRKPRRGGTGGWRSSYITKLLHGNEALIGIYQPHKMDEEGKRVPDGEPIPDYYPPAIDKKIYYEVQAVIKANSKMNGRGGGAVGQASNLFTYVAKCGHCGGALHYINKGEQVYLHCDYSRRKYLDEKTKERLCDAGTIRYDEFMKLFFRDFDELDIDQFLPGNDERNAEINKLQRMIDTAEYQLSELEDEIERLRTRIRKTKDETIADMYEADLLKTIAERDEWMKETEASKSKLESVQSNGKKIREDIDLAKAVFKLLKDEKDEQKVVEIKLRLRAIIRRICSVIEVYPLERRYKPVEEYGDGLLLLTNSNTIRKIRIRFNQSKEWRIINYQHVKDKHELEQIYI